MPHVEATHLLAWLDQLGWSSSNGMGHVPLSFAEIEAWARLTQTQLQPWEAIALREASDAYVAQLAARDEHEPYNPRQPARQARSSGFAAQAKAINDARSKS